jgi:lysophospholipase
VNYDVDLSHNIFLPVGHQVRGFLQPPMQGVVLQSYGSGNGPDVRTDIMDLFKQAAKRGCLIVNITQCNRGKVTAAYAAGKVC